MNHNQELRNKLYTAILGKRPSEISGVTTEIISRYLDSILPPLPPVTMKEDPNEPSRFICELLFYPWMLSDDEDESTN